MRLACMIDCNAGTSAIRLSHERALRMGLGPVLQTSRSSPGCFRRHEGSQQGRKRPSFNCAIAEAEEI